jgi:endonuclease YncB( thermonuclease family)
MRKAFLAVSLAVALVVPLTAVADRSGPSDPGGSFTDDDDNAHQGAIEAIATEGVTLGCNPPGNYLFCPDDNVTRGQMAAFINRARNLPATSSDFFADDAGSTFEDDINRMAAAGITRGCNPPANDEFCPDDDVTRGEMAAFLVRAFTLPSTSTDHFNDDDGSTFETDINRLAESAITRGCNPPSNTQFCPQDPIIRAHMATFLARALKLSIVEPPAPTRVPVASITDGDTIRVFLDGDNEPLRLIGIDTPESGDLCFDEATDAMADLVAGQLVRIDIDESDRDSFGRLLRYVFLTDGTFVNAAMVSQGWATAAEFPPDIAFASLFSMLEDQAQAADRGIWGDNCSNGGGGGDNCDGSYPDVCIPPPPPDLDCPDISHRNFRVLPPDPHRFDGDNDGIGCET